VTLPIDLIWVRHGESEGNRANKASRKGDNRHFTPAFRDRHSSHWRLTDDGIYQAKMAGLWILENITFQITRHYVTEYARGKETAGYLGLGAVWYPEDYLREREYGDLDVLTDEERKEKFAEVLAKRDIHPWYWKPTNGESSADVNLRTRVVYEKLHQDYANGHTAAILVAHGDVISADSRRSERMSLDDWIARELSRDPMDQIHNCQIIHQTRRNPSDPEEILPYRGWVRSICPWDLSLSTNEWRAIDRYQPTDDDLLAEVSRIPRLVND